MTKTTLTRNEKLVLAAMAHGFNYDTPEAEKADNAVAMVVPELAKITGKSIPSVRGTVGSLTKKGMLCEMEAGELGQLQCIGITDAGIDAFYAMGDFHANDDKSGDEAGSVEVYFDKNPEVRSWTVIKYDAEGNQTAPAIYFGSRGEAQRLAEEAARTAKLTGYTLQNVRGRMVSYTFHGDKTKKTVWG